MAFNESFVAKETNDKQEAIAEALQWFQQEEKNLYNDVENREEASESNTKKLYYEQLLEQTNPTIAELIKNNNIEVDYDDKELTVPFKIEFSNGGGSAPTINEYKVILTQDWVQIKWELDENRSLSWDEEYEWSLDSIVNKIEKELIERAWINWEKLSEKIHNKLEATKKVFTALFKKQN